MIRIVYGNVGCLSEDTKVLTDKGYVKISQLDKSFMIATINNDGEKIFTSEYLLVPTGYKLCHDITVDNKVYHATSNHKWFVYIGEKVKEVTTDKLDDKKVLCYECERPEGEKESYVDRYRRGKNHIFIQKQSFNSKNFNNVECLNNCHNPQVKEKQYKNSVYGRTSQNISKTGNMEKRKFWETKPIIQAWKIYWDKENNERLPVKSETTRPKENMCMLSSDKRYDIHTSHKHDKNRQSERKSYDAMSKMSCKTAYVSKEKRKYKTFDIIVPRYNNFILENGLITHNSGKTASTVREMYQNQDRSIVYSNIKTKGIKNNFLINKSMIVKEEIIDYKKNGQPIIKQRLNKEFWQDVVRKHKGISIIIDEAHTLINARRSTSKLNVIMGDFLSLIRKILGSSPYGNQELVLITQLERRIDCIAKEQATNIRYHVCWYIKTCRKCGCSFTENNEVPEPQFSCPSCGKYALKKHGHYVEVWHFQNNECFQAWKYEGFNTYHKHYIINDIEEYFNNYDTMQWDNLISD